MVPQQQLPRIIFCSSLCNAGPQARRAAGARGERTLAAVACRPLLDRGSGTGLRRDAPPRRLRLTTVCWTIPACLRSPPPRRRTRTLHTASAEGGTPPQGPGSVSSVSRLPRASWTPRPTTLAETLDQACEEHRPRTRPGETTWEPPFGPHG